jgi:hypothetical protein
MEFHETMDFETRMKNLCRLTPKKEMVEIMSNEYAKLYSKPFDEVFDKMWGYTKEFQEKYHRKSRLKKAFFGNKIIYYSIVFLILGILYKHYKH